jgi:GTP-binding protein
MPQTRFVLRKALDHGLRPILVVNKIDKPEERAEQVVDEVFDLLVELGADDTQLEFPVVYASAKQGLATTEYGGDMKDLTPVLDTILEHAPAPKVDQAGPLQFQAVTLGYDAFVGRLVIGRVVRGTMKRGAPVVRVGEEGAQDAFRITKLFGTLGTDRVDIEEARAGDIVIVAGVDHIQVGDTVCEPNKIDPLPRIAIDPPTIRVSLSVNNSPFAGRDGKYVTSRQIGERLEREGMSNISIVIERTDKQDTFAVSGRGELQLAVLIETLRREGYEFAVSRPEIIVQEIAGKRCEPVEEVVADVPETAAGSVMEKLAQRKGRMDTMEHHGDRVQMRFIVPSRGLFGYRGEFLTDTRGEGILYRTVQGFEPFAGDLPGRTVGPVVCTDLGKTTPHSIFKIQERATLFVPPGVDVYEGQIVGESRRAEGEEARQHARLRSRRERDHHAAQEAHDRRGARLDRGRRAPRGHAERAATPKEGPLSELPEALTGARRFRKRSPGRRRPGASACWRSQRPGADLSPRPRTRAPSPAPEAGRSR